jgi:FkbH-like protein
MFESEANSKVLAGAELPPEIVARFAESRATVGQRTLLPWGEHCTECVWPTCYTTCDLYAARPDGRCRRFVEGMVRIDSPGALNGYILKITFKRWAKLWCMGNSRLHPLASADRREKADLRVAGMIQWVPITALQNELIHKRYSLKKRWARRPQSEARPNCFLLECYNPGAKTISMTLTLRRDDSPIPFQKLLPMQPGFNRHHVGMEEIARTFSLSSPFQIELVPNEISEGATLYFGAMDFAVDQAYAAPKAAKSKPRICKCVVWDLDHTLWDGILLEDGPEKIRLKPRIAEIVKQLDSRGILLSVASKNNPDDALAALRRFGLEEYFLFPQIGWEPKSQSLRKLAAQLNIGLDSLLFIDDSAFERGEVAAACPEVMIADAADYLGILDRPDCQAPVTEESKKRRLFYREQQVRDHAQHEFAGDYLAFLRECNLRLTIRSLEESNLERVHELTQRTNQMNFSGNRYTRERLRELMADEKVDTYVIDCEDRFGSYGTIGFCTVQSRQPRMTDLMFSCRVQAKRVEHAVFSYLLHRYRALGDFFADYRKTEKNAKTGRVFEEIGFETLGVQEGTTNLVFRKENAVPDDGIAAIVDVTESVTTA